jgi:hypothetical protein
LHISAGRKKGQSIVTVHPWQERRPSRAKVLGVYSKRILLRNFNSSPYLSGDLFADNADYVHNPTKFRYNRSWFRDLKDAQVIFCPSGDLEDFFLEFGSSIRAKVILAGNGDFDFVSVPNSIPTSVRHLFLQNSFVSDGKTISTLPIGIENIRYGVNGFPKDMKPIGGLPKKNKVLVGPFGLTHDDRIKAFSNFKFANNNLDVAVERLKPKEFSALMQGYNYVAAIRGNGVDTHRLWESLYRGVTPILKYDDWSRSLGLYNLPIAYVNDWDVHSIQTILNVQPQFIEPKKLPALWWPYWKMRISDFL